MIAHVCSRYSVWSMVLVVTLLTGCQSTTESLKPNLNSIRVGVSKQQVLETLGVPKRVTPQRDGQILTYNFTSGEGLGVGVAYAGAKVLFAHKHIRQDIVEVLLDKSGRVSKTRHVDLTGDCIYTCWPFGD